jgi:hypothetical protein
VKVKGCRHNEVVDTVLNCFKHKNPANEKHWNAGDMCPHVGSMSVAHYKSTMKIALADNLWHAATRQASQELQPQMGLPSSTPFK